MHCQPTECTDAAAGQGPTGPHVLTSWPLPETAANSWRDDCLSPNFSLFGLFFLRNFNLHMTSSPWQGRKYYYHGNFFPKLFLLPLTEVIMTDLYSRTFKNHGQKAASICCLDKARVSNLVASLSHIRRSVSGTHTIHSH